jgi:hypothetical protein
MSKKKGDKKKKKGEIGRKDTPTGSGMITNRLELVAETKLKALLPKANETRFEASGVAYHGDHFYIVLDNSSDIVRIHSNLETAAETAELITLDGEGNGYEDIAYQSDHRREPRRNHVARQQNLCGRIGQDQARQATRTLHTKGSIGSYLQTKRGALIQAKRAAPWSKRHSAHASRESSISVAGGIRYWLKAALPQSPGRSTRPT